MAILAIALVLGMTAVGCSDDSTDNTPKPITFISTDSAGNTYTLTITPQKDNTLAKGDSYELTITKGATINVSKGTIYNVAGGELKMKPNNSETTFIVTVDGEKMTKIEGKIAVQGEEEALDEPGELTVTEEVAVTLNSVTPNGSSTQTTTQLTLTFSQAITGLTAADITLTGVLGVTKGTLSNSEATYTLPISGFTAGGTLNVAVAKTGYTISGSPKTVTIYYYSGSSGGESNVSDFEFVLGDEASVKKYIGTGGSVTIPALIFGIPVTGINNEAFKDCTSLTSVTIPNSVTSILGGAFKGCTSLTSIGREAFWVCTGLTSVTFATGSNIPDAYFGINAFPEGSYGEGGNSLKTAYSTGKAGTYKRAANGSTWTKS